MLFFVCLLFIYGDNNVLTIDIPILGDTVKSTFVSNAVGKNDLGDCVAVTRYDIGKLCASGNKHIYAIGNIEIGILTHGLYLRDDLTYVALLDKLVCERCVKSYRNVLVSH